LGSIGQLQGQAFQLNIAMHRVSDLGHFACSLTSYFKNMGFRWITKGIRIKKEFEVLL
jgi:hypothetical protein